MTSVSCIEFNQEEISEVCGLNFTQKRVCFKPVENVVVERAINQSLRSYQKLSKAFTEDSNCVQEIFFLTDPRSDIPNASVLEDTKILHCGAYRAPTVHQCRPADPHIRLNFLNGLFTNIHTSIVDPQLHFMIKEAWFHCSSYINKKGTCNWLAENHVIYYRSHYTTRKLVYGAQ
jgi:hypothetical protein